MLRLYIRGCENSTLANVLPPFCTALGVQTPLYRECILYSNEVLCLAILRSYSVHNCIAIHACFAMQYNRGETIVYNKFPLVAGRMP